MKRKILELCEMLMDRGAVLTIYKDENNYTEIQKVRSNKYVIENEFFTQYVERDFLNYFILDRQDRTHYTTANIARIDFTDDVSFANELLEIGFEFVLYNDFRKYVIAADENPLNLRVYDFNDIYSGKINPKYEIVSYKFLDNQIKRDYKLEGFGWEVELC